MDVLVGAFLILGAAAANGSQIYVMIRNRSCHGVSSLSFWLSWFSSLLLTYNILLIQWDKWIVTENDQSLIEWTRHSVAIGQVATGCIWSATVLGVIVIFQKRIINKVAICVGLLLSVPLTCAAGVIVWKDMNAAREFGHWCGYISLPITAVVWLPQIVVTVITRDISSLSSLLICTHVFGSMLVLFYQVVLEEEHWTTWASEAVAFAEHVLLTAIYGYLLIRIPRKKKNVVSKEEVPSEYQDKYDAEPGAIEMDLVEQFTKIQEEEDMHADWLTLDE